MNGLGAAYVRRWFAVLIGGTVAIAAPTALALAQGRPAPTAAGSAAPSTAPAGTAAAASPRTTESGIPCVSVQGDDTCSRIAHDAQVRTPLTSAQRAAAVSRVPAVRALIKQAVCPSPCGDPGQPPPDGDGPGPMALELARRSLAQAGFDDVAVRRAGPDDPAPTDAVIYAAAVGPACVLVYQVGWTGPDGDGVVGRRPDGHCLAP